MVDQQLFSKGWTGEDELKLLRSLEENGYGNWLAVSEDLKKPPEECYVHYHKYYFSWTDTEVPDFKKLPPTTPEDFICNFGSMDLPGREIPHYNPLRNDFAIEHNDVAEKALTITDLVFDDTEEHIEDDDVIMKDLVLALVDSYLKKLEWREKIKDVIEEHGLIEIYRLLSLEKTLTSNEQLTKKTIRPFVRFFSRDELNDTERSFNRETALINKVKSLQEYRYMGIKTLKSAELYERMKLSQQDLREKQVKKFRKILKLEESFYRRNNIASPHSVLERKMQLSVVPLDISVCSGVDWLQNDEKTFCSINRILPEIFFRCKKLMTIEYKKSGYIRLMDARRICRIDVNKTRKIYNFLTEKNIIRTYKEH